MTRLVLLDAGGVLFNNISEDSPFFALLARRFAVDEQALRHHYESQDHAFEIGTITGVEAVIGALALLGVADGHAHTAEIRGLYADSVRPNAPLLDFLRQRRARGRPDGCHLTLANNEAQDWDLLKHRATRHLSLCDSLSSSWLLGLAKPDPAYFRAVPELLRFAPSRSLLVDDNPLCLAAAAGTGMATVRYSGTRELIQLLRDF
ncbi:HAD-IA family hydrolase [Streptomyces sp. MP131-18]|uniref:HAD family hydrolase n=1 Tax=Streptomyces sp. MP131-18 TaxID=1857892 RepID=UPI00097C9529|nr:HAD-IA family hydrolase [Streptomyces sp. MP131-18]ONK15806.1 HAD hydrolase, family IA, variant 3 [Streptomyces sp. MP131-18]